MVSPYPKGEDPAEGYRRVPGTLREWLQILGVEDIDAAEKKVRASQATLEAIKESLQPGQEWLFPGRSTPWISSHFSCSSIASAFQISFGYNFLFRSCTFIQFLFKYICDRMKIVRTMPLIGWILIK